MKPNRTTASIALVLPREHGAWSIAFEPVALGLLAAPSLAGGALALGVAAAFFARRPLQSVLQPDSCPAATAAANRTLVLVLGVTFLASLGAVFVTHGYHPLWPLAPAGLLGVAAFVLQLRGESRTAAAELASCAAFGLLPMAFANLAGLPRMQGLALSAIMLARSVPAVLVVRTYLRKRRQTTESASLALGASALAVVVAAGCIHLQLAGWPILGLTLALFLRSLWLLRPGAPQLRARHLGVFESAAGLGYVLTAALL